LRPPWHSTVHKCKPSLFLRLQSSGGLWTVLCLEADRLPDTPAGGVVRLPRMFWVCASAILCIMVCTSGCVAHETMLLLAAAGDWAAAVGCAGEWGVPLPATGRAVPSGEAQGSHQSPQGGACMCWSCIVITLRLLPPADQEYITPQALPHLHTPPFICMCHCTAIDAPAFPEPASPCMDLSSRKLCHPPGGRCPACASALTPQSRPGSAWWRAV
jgi:hypothetical protein